VSLRIACIVEGHGDARSIPTIVRRIAYAEGCFQLHAAGPYRVPKSRLVRPGELERAVERASRALEGAGAVLVVVDADDDLPCQLGPSLTARARSARPDMSNTLKPSGMPRVGLRTRQTGHTRRQRTKRHWRNCLIWTRHDPRGPSTDSTGSSKACFESPVGCHTALHDTPPGNPVGSAAGCTRRDGQRPDGRWRFAAGGSAGRTRLRALRGSLGRSGPGRRGRRAPVPRPG